MPSTRGPFTGEKGGGGGGGRGAAGRRGEAPSPGPLPTPPLGSAPPTSLRDRASGRIPPRPGCFWGRRQLVVAPVPQPSSNGDPGGRADVVRACVEVRAEGMAQEVRRGCRARIRPLADPHSGKPPLPAPRCPTSGRGSCESSPWGESPARGRLLRRVCACASPPARPGRGARGRHSCPVLGLRCRRACAQPRAVARRAALGSYPDPGLRPRRREVRMRESLAEVARPREGRVWRLARARHPPGGLFSLG